MLIIYKVKGKEVGLEFIFKYDLSGFLIEFKKNVELSEEQRKWLYSERFPESESLMQKWIAYLKSKFTVVKVYVFKLIWTPSCRN